jgi:hypothetical protein
VKQYWFTLVTNLKYIGDATHTVQDNIKNFVENIGRMKYLNPVYTALQASYPDLALQYFNDKK